MHRTARTFVSIVAVGSALTLGACTSTQADNAVEVSVLRGSTRVVDGLREGILFDGDRVSGPAMTDPPGGLSVAGAHWFDGQTWHDSGAPACLEPGTRRQPVELGVVRAAPSEEGPGRSVVVWLKCLQPRG